MGNGIYKVIDKFHIAENVDILITEGTNVYNNAKSILLDELRTRACEYKYSEDGVDITLDSL